MTSDPVATLHRMTQIEFSVFGKPGPKGSVVAFVPRTKGGGYAKRPDGSPLVVKHDDVNEAGVAWAQAVTVAALDAMRDQGIAQVLDAPVEVSIVFAQPRPKGHYGTGANSAILKLQAPARPVVRPDVDKLVRAALDAISRTLYHDDSQVVTLMASKVYVDVSEPYRTDVVVRVLDDEQRFTRRPAAQLALVA